MTRMRYTTPAGSQGEPCMRPTAGPDAHRVERRRGDPDGSDGGRCGMTIVAVFDIALLATLPGRTIEPAAMDRHGAVRSGPLTLYGRSPFAHAICVQPREGERKPFTVGLVRVRTRPTKATLELCDRLSNPLIEVDAAVRGSRPDVVCDLGYGVAPHDVIDEGAAPVPIPDYRVLWPGKPTTNTVWTAVEGYTWFEAFSEEGCATGIACTPAPHLRSERKTEDGRRKER